MAVFATNVVSEVISHRVGRWSRGIFWFIRGALQPRVAAMRMKIIRSARRVIWLRAGNASSVSVTRDLPCKARGCYCMSLRVRVGCVFSHTEPRDSYRDSCVSSGLPVRHSVLVRPTTDLRLADNMTDKGIAFLRVQTDVVVSQQRDRHATENSFGA